MRNELYKIGDRRFQIEGRACSRNKGSCALEIGPRQSYEAATEPGIKLYKGSVT